MKIGIIAASNLRLSPYIFFYTKLFAEHNIEFEVIYPQRNKLKDNENFTCHELSWDANKSASANYRSYRKQVIQIIEKEKYDFLVVLTTKIAVYLAYFLITKYSGRYLVDIRDYTNEKKIIYYLTEKIVLRKSRINIISSARFKEFLPKEDYRTCHNISVDLDQVKTTFNKKPQEPIIIGYVGSVDYLEQCCRLIDLVNKDQRFAFHFYGTSAKEAALKEYAEKLSCDRIKFFGGYKPEDKNSIVAQVDILFNAYGNNSLLLKCALSNKLYDAFFYKKLLITSPKTAMSETAGKIAFDLDFSDTHILDKLHTWYRDLDEDSISEYMQEQCLKFLRENEETGKYIINKILQN